MGECGRETEFEHRLTETEERCKSNTHRLDNAEKRQDALDKLAESTGRMDTAAIVLTDKQAAKSCFSTCRMSWWGSNLI